MAQFQFKRATKEQSKLRLAVFGPSGSGKTYTSLRIATGMGGSIAFIDTERGSGSKYADRFTFDVPSVDIDTYCAAIKAASGYEVLVIDSLTHAWQELLAQVDQLAKARYQGNTWSAWSDGTPKQRQLVDALLSFPGHIIATMRSKTEWTTSKDERTGRNKPERVGLAPEQGKGIEYEFDMLIELTADHLATVIKDRTGKFQDKMIDRPSEDFGRELVAWLQDAPPPTRTAPATAPAPEPTAQAAPWDTTPTTETRAELPKNVGWETWPENGQKRFWAACNELNLSREAVHREFAVQSMKDCQLSLVDAGLVLKTLDYGMKNTALSLEEVKAALNVMRMVDIIGLRLTLEICHARIDAYIAQRAAAGNPVPQQATLEV
jgi:hypothetical protein